MRFFQSKTEKAAKRLRQPRHIVPGNLRFGFRRRVLSESGGRIVAWRSLALVCLSVRIVGKFPSPMIPFTGNAYFSRFPRVLITILTVKVRNEYAENFLPSDLPSKIFAGIAPKNVGGAKKQLIAQRVRGPPNRRQPLAFSSLQRV